MLSRPLTLLSAGQESASKIARASGRWPEALVLLVSGCAWVLLVRLRAPPDWAALCASLPDSGWARLEGAINAAWRTGAWHQMTSWALMTFAMVPTLNLPLWRFVAARSFAHRRVQAVTAFIFGVLAVWLLTGIALLPVLMLSATWDSAHALTGVAGFSLAALWQITPKKRAALQRCHRTAPLRASGWPAARDCIIFGMQTTSQCVASCWAMMLACALVSHSLAALLLVQLIAVHERALHVPPLSRHALLLAAFAAALTVSPGGLP